MSQFTDDCRAIGEWGRETGRLHTEWMNAHPGLKFGVDFTWKDLPSADHLLPSGRKSPDHMEGRTSPQHSGNLSKPPA